MSVELHATSSLRKAGMTKPDARMSASGESVESIRIARSEARWSWQTESPAPMVQKNVDSRQSQQSEQKTKISMAGVQKLFVPDHPFLCVVMSK